MPRTIYELSESHRSITRPITYSVIKDIMMATGIPSTTPIVYNGDSETALAFGSTIVKEPVPVKFSGEEQLVVDCQEIYFEDSTLTTAVQYKEHLPLFDDPNLGINIKPVYADTEVSFTIRYRTDSKVDAIAWRDGIRRRSSQSVVENLHHLNYHYPLKVEHLITLIHLHELRENVAGYGDDIKTYIKKYISPKATTYRTMDGSNPEIVFEEKQVNVVGYYDFTNNPEIEKGENDGTWISSVTYKIRYDKIISMVMEYPLMVHNQIIGENFRLTGIDYNQYFYTEPKSNLRYNLDGVKKSNIPNPTMISGITIPEFDEWLPARIEDRTASMFRIMLEIDPDNPRFLLNMNELGDFEINQDILSYMSTNSHLLNHYSKAAVYVTLYKGEYPMMYNDIVIDSDLNVFAETELDLRQNYHLRIALVTDLSFLGTDENKILREDPLACHAIMRALDCTLESRGLLPKILEDEYIPQREFLNTIKHIRMTHPMYQSCIEKFALHVGSYSVVVHS